ncbi:hypothetical protein ACFQE1_10505 [Halobium palmae]|uniref:Uncharacterized protein n=1 Tax=Halobium palmae TaxID=1776492 RepID=A0ABD5RZH0_9EURY
MAAGTQSRSDGEGGGDPAPTPQISVCESCPGRTVFIEADNTDGWLSSDVTTDVVR